MSKIKKLRVKYIIKSFFFFLCNQSHCWCRNKTICDGISDFSTLQETCGRPLGLSFYYQTGELFIADAYLGLVKVPYYGGAATQLVAHAQGSNPFGFLSGVDVEPDTGTVYFTEASSGFKLR